MTTFALLLLTATSPRELTVAGPGYFRLLQAGRIVFAKNLSLQVIDHRLGGQKGSIFFPEVTCSNLSHVKIEKNGDVKEDEVTVGRIVLAQFNSSSLQPLGSGLFAAQDRPNLAYPSETAGWIDNLQAAPESPKANLPMVTVTKPVKKPEPVKQAPAKTEVKTVIAPSSQDQIVFHATTTMDGDRITIADIADISGPHAKAFGPIDLGDVPAVGVARRLGQNWVYARLRAAGFTTDKISIQMPPSVEVKRDCQVIPAAKFVDLVREEAKKRFNIKAPLIEPRSTPDFQAPKGNATFEIDNLNQTANGVNAGVAVLVDGKRFNSRFVVLTFDSAAGKVQSGEIVKVLIKLNGAAVEIGGHARNNAFVGQPVSVTTDTGATLQGKLVAVGIVEVQL
ncbi:MAG: hypothetical protein JSS72_07700 [Armatimonadetes bacterium]|nr:hypothetical protein [Armatimonadota bacterium]